MTEVMDMQEVVEVGDVLQISEGGCEDKGQAQDTSLVKYPLMLKNNYKNPIVQLSMTENGL